MKRIGVLGGMSWESTALYYRLLNEGVRARLGGLHSADLIVRSVDFADIEALQRAEDWATAGDVLAEAARELVTAGAELLALATNTMHLVADAFSDVGAPLVHIGDATASALRRADIRRAGLLGTRWTMERPFLKERLAVEILVPDAGDRDEIDRIVFSELCLGQVNQESREVYVAVARRMQHAGAQAIVLGCTEQELLLRPEDVELPLFPTTAIHVEALLDASLSGVIMPPSVGATT